MLIINKTKPFYFDKKNKLIRMGNFKDTGKEIDYEDDSILSIFENLMEPISKDDLIDKIKNHSDARIEEITSAIEYLIEEKFIIEYEKYRDIILNEKYNRQDLFFNMFTDEYKEYRNRFVNTRVLILGLGGIGSNVALLLSRAGFSNFVLVDCDKVEESNLIRQIPYDISDVGRFKTDCLAEKISNSNNNVNTKNIKVLSKNDIEEEIKNSDFVLCTLDKPIRKIRRLINNICVKNKKPVLFCGFSEHVGMIGPFVIPNKTACLKCIERQMSEEPLNNIDLVPSYGPLCSLISSIASSEIINFFVKYNNNSLVGKTLMFNMATYESKIVKWDKNLNCKECGTNAIK